MIRLLISAYFNSPGKNKFFIFAKVLSFTYPERQRVMALRSLDNLSPFTAGKGAKSIPVYRER
jgi:hypothetical protein